MGRPWSTGYRIAQDAHDSFDVWWRARVTETQTLFGGTRYRAVYDRHFIGWDCNVRRGPRRRTYDEAMADGTAFLDAIEHLSGEFVGKGGADG